MFDLTGGGHVGRIRPAHAPPTSALVKLTVAGAVIGIPAAFAAALFLAAAREIEHLLWHVLPGHYGHASPPWYLVLGLPAIGALIVLAARTWLPGDGGGRPLKGLSSEQTQLSHVPGIAIAALATLGFGAVLGPEAPVIALGSAAGVAFTRLAKIPAQGRAVLSGAGSLFSAISALFGGPIVAGILLVEDGVGIGAALLPALVPGLVAAAVGYLIFLGLGSWGGLNAPGLIVPHLPAYTGLHVYDLLIALVIGLLVAPLLDAVKGLGARIERLRERLGMAVLLVGGGLVVGLLALLARWLGANSQDVLFSGQASVGVLVGKSAGVILVLLVTKSLAYGVSLGCGFRGGPIFPSIFLGVAVASLAVAWFGTSPTLAIAVGASAGMASQTRLLIAPLVLAALLVGTAGGGAAPAAAIASSGRLADGAGIAGVARGSARGHPIGLIAPDVKDATAAWDQWRRTCGGSSAPWAARDPLGPPPGPRRM